MNLRELPDMRKACYVNEADVYNKIEEKNHIKVQQRKDTILYFGTYEETYSRNQIMIKTLKGMGCVVKECHISLWGNKTDKTGLFKRSYDTFVLLFHLLTVYPRLVLKYLSADRYDIVFVGYPGHVDILIVKFLEFVTRRRKKIIFDVFISLYDTIVNDRRMVKADSALGGFLFQLDRISCSFADVILLDTQAHIDFFRREFKIPDAKTVKIYAGADTDIFYPRNIQRSHKGCQVLFIGKYTPLHGIEHIVAAAELLKDQGDVRFVFIGKGQLYEYIRGLVDKRRLGNIAFIEWAPYESLPDYIEEADICLGIFSKSAKANRVIPNKIFQAMAMGKAIISGKTDAVLECLTHGEDIFLCEPGDPAALAGAIMTLKSDEALRRRIGIKAMHTFQRDAGDKAMAKGLEEALKRIQ